MKKLVLILALVALACGPVVSGDAGPHLPAVSSYDLWLDASVSATNRAALNIAVRQWTTHTDVQITIHDGGHLCLAEGCLNVAEVSLQDFNALAGEDYVGYTVPGLIVLTAPITWDEMQDMAIHEVGHALGLPHPCAAPCSIYAVMNPTYSHGADRVSCYDVSQFYLVRNREIPPTSNCTDVPGTLPLTADAVDAGGGNPEAAPTNKGGGPPPRPTTSTRPE